MKMKTLLTIVALFSFVSLSAQTGTPTPQLKGIKRSLSQPANSKSGVVNITEYEDASAIINMNLYSAPQYISGYRIVIFMSNVATARREAQAIREDFIKLKTGEESYLSYTAPYFKVSIGNFLNEEEATMMLRRIHKRYPKAFITQERINIKEFGK